MKSIMQDKDGRCYLCMKLHDDYSVKPTEEHHVIFGWANRRLSEKYGLKVYLCSIHHEYGKAAVHVNPKIRQELCADGQRAFNKHYPNLSFREIFGKNWVDENAPRIEYLSAKTEIDGFQLLESQLTGDDELCI